MPKISKPRWGCCQDGNAPEENSIKCVKCCMAFHYSCMSIAEISNESNWICPQCTSLTPRVSRSDFTPLQNASVSRGSKRPAINSPSPPAASNSSENLRSTIQEVLRTEFSSMLRQFNDSLKSAINEELLPIRDEMKDIKESMSFINNKFEEIKTEQETAVKITKHLQAENDMLKQTVGNLNTRIDYLEQQSRSSNLEIQCVPEKKQEDLYRIVMQLAKHVNCELTKADIQHCTRTAKITSSNTRPRSIIIKLTSLRMRDELLASTIKFNKANPQDRLNSTHLGISGPKSAVYVVEHLSPTNKALHAATRIRAKEKGYKFVWVRSGRIFARKSEDSEYILIKNMDSLDKLI